MMVIKWCVLLVAAILQEQFSAALVVRRRGNSHFQMSPLDVSTTQNGLMSSTSIPSSKSASFDQSVTTTTPRGERVSEKRSTFTNGNPDSAVATTAPLTLEDNKDVEQMQLLSSQALDPVEIQQLVQSTINIKLTTNQTQSNMSVKDAYRVVEEDQKIIGQGLPPVEDPDVWLERKLQEEKTIRRQKDELRRAESEKRQTEREQLFETMNSFPTTTLPPLPVSTASPKAAAPKTTSPKNPSRTELEQMIGPALKYLKPSEVQDMLALHAFNKNEGFKMESEELPDGVSEHQALGPNSPKQLVVPGRDGRPAAIYNIMPSSEPGHEKDISVQISSEITVPVDQADPQANTAFDALAKKQIQERKRLAQLQAVQTSGSFQDMALAMSAQ